MFLCNKYFQILDYIHETDRNIFVGNEKSKFYWIVEFMKERFCESVFFRILVQSHGRDVEEFKG